MKVFILMQGLDSDSGTEMNPVAAVSSLDIADRWEQSSSPFSRGYCRDYEELELDPDDNEIEKLFKQTL